MNDDDIIIGIDPGTNCGWAILRADGTRVGSGVWDLNARRHEGGGMRFLRLRSYLNALCDAGPIAAVAYEEVRRHSGTDAAHVYGGIVAILSSWCDSLGIPYQGQPVGAVKKLATGNGASDKLGMVIKANERWWGVNIPYKSRQVTKKKKTKAGTVEVEVTEHTFPGGGDNEADALWIAETMRRSL